MARKLYGYEEILSRAKSELPKIYSNLENKIDQYHELVYQELIYGYYLANMEQIRNNQVPFNINGIRRKLGRYGNKPQRYWWDWLHKNFPLIEVHKKGNSIQGVRSMVSPVDIPMDIVLAGGDSKEIVKAVYSEFDLESDIDIVPINIKSLENYVAHTHAQNNVNQVIQRNLKDARIILTVAREMEGHLAQIISHSSFGRTYYKGINLQNVHKIVRHAALGDCYSVDINNAVFNWKYAFAITHFDPQELTYTRELITDKNRVRKHLTEKVFGTVNDYNTNLIKRVLTAVGFGARATTKGWFKKADVWTQGAISEIIYDKALRDILFQDDWMCKFMEEQDKINKYIGDEFMRCAQNGEIPEEYLKDLRSERGKLSRGKLIAWAYQHSEAHVMDNIIEASNAEVLLKVHDGVYFKTKPDMQSMQTVLRNHWKLASLKIEEICKFTYVDREFDNAHKQVIENQERIANNGALPYKEVVKRAEIKEYNPHNEPNWDAIMIEKHSEPDYPDMVKQLLGR